MTRFIVKLFGAAAGLAVSIGATVASPEANALMDRARQLIFEGKPTEAARALEDALVALARSMPLTIRSAVLVQEVTAFGAYQVRTSNAFLPTDEIRLYVEPMGFSYAQENGRYRAEFSGDFELRLPTGQTVIAQTGVAHFTFDSARPNREFYIRLSYNFEGLMPGDYTIVTRLDDRVGGKSASFETPIRILAPSNRSPTAAKPAQ
jgi:hypothetical protein